MDEVERPPWWMSDDQDAEQPRETAASWSSLLGSLGSLSSLGSLGSLGTVASELWAASGAADHGQHTDPAENPECIVCRAMVAFAASSPEVRELPGIRWLPTRRV
ncbi:MAG: hypothetical protein ACO3LZ_10020 [Candidatus Nanopelagicales bacterium]